MLKMNLFFFSDFCFSFQKKKYYETKNVPLNILLFSIKKKFFYKKISAVCSPRYRLALKLNWMTIRNPSMS